MDDLHYESTRKVMQATTEFSNDGYSSVLVSYKPEDPTATLQMLPFQCAADHKMVQEKSRSEIAAGKKAFVFALASKRKSA